VIGFEVFTDSLYYVLALSEAPPWSGKSLHNRNALNNSYIRVSSHNSEKKVIDKNRVTVLVDYNTITMAEAKVKKRLK
jgi:hypothetical protein